MKKTDFNNLWVFPFKSQFNRTWVMWHKVWILFEQPTCIARVKTSATNWTSTREIQRESVWKFCEQLEAIQVLQLSKKKKKITSSNLGFDIHMQFVLIHCQWFGWVWIRTYQCCLVHCLLTGTNACTWLHTPQPSYASLFITSPW